MSRPAIPAALRLAVRQQAAMRCEYCLLSESDGLVPHEVDHIVARQHHGATTGDNLALACFACNRRKGANIASVDPTTGKLVPLFHPRHDVWAEHFRLQGARILPLTPQGRATAELLQFNSHARLRRRQLWLNAGRYPG
ncbi:MAG: HNH endonuclease [Verrucomicrobia bacterium]|nr:HNH endonuclease [Verrucomicrobiota bacterium]